MGTGHLGERSRDLIAYYEAVPGVQRAPEGLNPATWMLEVTMPGNEERLGVDFAEVYKQSKLNRCGLPSDDNALQCLAGPQLSLAKPDFSMPLYNIPPPPLPPPGL